MPWKWLMIQLFIIIKRSAYVLLVSAELLRPNKVIWCSSDYKKKLLLVFQKLVQHLGCVLLACKSIFLLLIVLMYFLCFRVMVEFVVRQSCCVRLPALYTLCGTAGNSLQWQFYDKCNAVLNYYDIYINFSNWKLNDFHFNVMWWCSILFKNFGVGFRI